MARITRGVPRPLLAFHLHQAFLERLRWAARPSFVLHEVASWSELQNVLVAVHAPLVIVDPFTDDPRGGDTRRDVRSLLAISPAATVVAAISGRRGNVHDLWALTQLGIGAVISIDEDTTPEAIRRRLHSVGDRPFGDVLNDVVNPGVVGRGRMLVGAAADVALAGGDARDLARVTHASARTLERWCTEARLPPPRRLLLWARILLAARLLDDPRRSAESVAESCGYGSKQALYRAMRLASNESLGRAGGRGVFHTAVCAFLAELERLRAA